MDNKQLMIIVGVGSVLVIFIILYFVLFRGVPIASIPIASIPIKGVQIKSYGTAEQNSRNFTKKPGVYAPGFDIETLDTTDINQCYIKCEDNINCGNFAFNGNKCFIKSTLRDDAYTGISNEWTTYVRRTAPPVTIDNTDLVDISGKWVLNEAGGDRGIIDITKINNESWLGKSDNGVTMPFSYIVNKGYRMEFPGSPIDQRPFLTFTDSTRKILMFTETRHGNTNVLKFTRIN